MDSSFTKASKANEKKWKPSKNRKVLNVLRAMDEKKHRKWWVHKFYSNFVGSNPAWDTMVF